jgi:hypothetical protein
MRSIQGYAFILMISLLGFSVSCVPAPRQTQPSSTAPVNKADAKGIDTSKNKTPNPSPLPATDAIAALHTDQKSCATCHSYPSFSERKLFSHIPKPETCETCHARPAGAGLRAYPNEGPPAGFNPNDATAPGSGHYIGKDCVTCHATPAEGARAFVFSHSTPRAEFCLPCHFNDGRGEHNGDGDVTLRDFGNCYSCHRNFADRNFDAID